MSGNTNPLGTNEVNIGNYQFSYSIVLFFLKSNFRVTDKRILGNAPNLFWIIPVGNQDVMFPFNHIATVAISTKLLVIKLIIGIILAWIGLSLFQSNFFIAFILLLLGIIQVLASFQTSILIRNSSGEKILYPIAPWEKSKAQKLIKDVNQVLIERA